MDPKKKRQLAAALAVVAVLLWVRGLFGRPARSKQPSPSVVSHPLPLTPYPLSPSTQPPTSSRYTEWGGNPFEIERRSATAPATGAPAYSSPSGHAVSGILWDAKMPSAIVNGRLVGLGDELAGGWKVIEIQKDKVILSDGLTTHTLTVD